MLKIYIMLQQVKPKNRKKSSMKLGTETGTLVD